MNQYEYAARIDAFLEEARALQAFATTELPRQQQIVSLSEKKMVDYNHIIELVATRPYESSRVVTAMRQAMAERRDAKDFDWILRNSAFLLNKILPLAMNMSKQTHGHMRGQDERKYAFRTEEGRELLLSFDHPGIDLSSYGLADPTVAGEPKSTLAVPHKPAPSIPPHSLLLSRDKAATTWILTGVGRDGTSVHLENRSMSTLFQSVSLDLFDTIYTTTKINYDHLHHHAFGLKQTASRGYLTLLRQLFLSNPQRKIVTPKYFEHHIQQLVTS